MSEQEIDPFIENIAGELKRAVRFDAAFESRVMAAIEPPAATKTVERDTSTPWLLRPRTFYVSPLAGLAVAAGIVAIVTMSVLRTLPSKQLAEATNRDTLAVLLPNQFIPVSSAAAPVPVAAPFTYIGRAAKSVAVVGSFNDWDATRNVLHLTTDGVWTGTIPLLPGRYEYQLVVDGKWIADPGAQQTAASEFGSANSVMIVSPVPR